MAHACFNAAAQTLTTLEKRGQKMSSILIKLAEVTFLLYDFKASELMADTLIARALPDQGSMLFALLLKAYFCRLKNELAQADEFVCRARAIQSDASIDNLPIIKRMRQKRDKIDAARDEMPGVMSQADQADQGSPGSSQALGAGNRLKLCMPQSDGEDQSRLKVFAEFYAHFLGSFGGQLEATLNRLGAKTCNRLVLDCSEYLSFLRANKPSFLDSWRAGFAQGQSQPQPVQPAAEDSATQNNKQAAAAESQAAGKVQKVPVPKRG